MTYLKQIVLIAIIALSTACNSAEDTPDKKGASIETLKEETNGRNNNADSVLTVINDKLAESPKDASLYQERAYHLFYNVRSMSSDTTSISIIEEPIRDIKRAIELDPENPEYYFSKGFFFHATLQLAEAETAFKQAIEKDENYQDAYFFLAKIYHVLGRPSDRDKFNYDKAREMLNRSIELDESHVESYFLRGLIYLELGDSAGALNAFKTVTDIDPEHYSGYIQQGALYTVKGNPKAEVVYRQALEIRPESIEALFALAWYQQRVGKYEKAENNYLKIVEMDSMYAIAYLNLGYMYMTYDTAYTKAIDYLHKAIYFNPGSFLAGTYFNIGRAYEAQGKMDKAITYFKQALKVDNDYIDAALAIEKIERGLPLSSLKNGEVPERELPLTIS